MTWAVNKYSVSSDCGETPESRAIFRHGHLLPFPSKLDWGYIQIYNLVINSGLSVSGSEHFLIPPFQVRSGLVFIRIVSLRSAAIFVSKLQ